LVVTSSPHLVERVTPSWAERATTVNGYAVIIEGEGDSYSGYAPDLPGCVAAGSSPDDVEQLMREAVALHIESLRANGEVVPEPSVAAATVVRVA